jgi:hypothetical protein
VLCPKPDNPIIKIHEIKAFIQNSEPKKLFKVKYLLF